MENIKTTIINRIIVDVETQIKNAEKGRSNAIEESKAHKGAMASRYDTFKEEAQYLTGGYTVQLIELERTLNVLKFIRDHPPIVVKGTRYAMVEVENLSDRSRSKYFLLPGGGGKAYEIDGETITILNIGAPLASKFIGSVAGDEVEIKVKSIMRRFIIISII